MTSTVTGWPLSVRTAVGKLKRRRMSSTSHGGHLSNSGQHGISSTFVSVVVVSFSILVAPYLFPCVADTFRFRLRFKPCISASHYDFSRYNWANSRNEQN